MGQGRRGERWGGGRAIFSRTSRDYSMSEQMSLEYGIETKSPTGHGQQPGSHKHTVALPQAEGVRRLLKGRVGPTLIDTRKRKKNILYHICTIDRDDTANENIYTYQSQPYRAHDDMCRNSTPKQHVRTRSSTRNFYLASKSSPSSTLCLRCQK